jgi:hydroxymethylpyrimidine pyrophosphatase-like HAD family hydrolase
VLDHIELHNLSGCLSVHLHLQDKVYISNLNGASVRFFAKSTVEPIVMGNLRPLLTESITKMMVMSDESQVFPRLSSQLKNSHSRIQVKQYESITLLEAFHPNVSKRMAVGYLAEEIMGLRPENVMAVGDDFTDIEMLQYAGIGIAMGNAPGIVKASADWVTTTIEQDGAARAIEKWILAALPQSHHCLT